MSAAVAALIGAAIGAIAGLAGGGFAALAAIRASQVAARVELAPKLHALARALVTLSGVTGTGTASELKARRDMELAWNDFGTHQRILCPSRALPLLALIFRRSAKPEEGERFTTEVLLTLAGQAQERAALITGLYSEHLFRWRARRGERKIIADWLAGDAHGVLSDEMRVWIAKDLGLGWWQRRRIKPADG